ncbi:MAG: mobilization protein, partial [Pseudomonadota bacterium]
LDLAAESGVGVVFWHVIDDGKDALVTLERLINRTGAQARICIVKNHGRGKDFSLFDRSPVGQEAQRLGAAVLELPELNPAVMQKIDRLDASFWAAANGTNFGADTFSRIEGQRVKVWLTAAYDRISPII